MKKSKWIALLTTLVLVVSLVPSAFAASGFDDVKADAYYADAVSWAVANNVTKGTSETRFSPKKTCTRGEFVTFLYAYAGKPEAAASAGNPFKDVEKGRFYYDAVLWAVGAGVTKGTSATTFEPGKTCSRAEIVTFLYAFAGKPSVSGLKVPFIDTISGKYYFDAVLWAYNNAVTAGISSTEFGVKSDCTRAQVVMFLYKLDQILNKESVAEKDEKYSVDEKAKDDSVDEKAKDDSVAEKDPSSVVDKTKEDSDKEEEPSSDEMPEDSSKTVSVLMNVPYDVFFSDVIGIDSTGIDAVTSSTTKVKTKIFWDSSQKGSAPVAYGEEEKLFGVKFPVQVSESDYENLKKDLGKAADYYFEDLEEEPAVYAKAAVSDDGSVKLGKIQGETTELSDATATLDMSGNFGQYLIEIGNDGGVLSEAAPADFQVYGAVIKAGDKNYALQHLYGLYYKDFDEIAFSTTEDTTSKGLKVNADYYADLEGATITEIDFYTFDGIYTVPCSLTVGSQMVLMNIPYDDFYKDVLGISNTDKVDAVSSSTTKVKTKIFWDGSKDNATVGYGEDNKLYGVTFPVKLAADDYKNLKSDLSETEDYYCKDLEETPALYSTASVAKDGTVSLNALKKKPKTLEGATATLDTEGKHGEYLIEIGEDGGVLTEADKASFQVYGAIITADNGKSYATTHLINLYYKDFNEIAFNTTAAETKKGLAVDPTYYKDLEGATITNITFYTFDGVYSVGMNIKVAK